MADKVWKQFERTVCAFFGGLSRAKAHFGYVKNNSDIIHDTLHVQCKHSKRHAVVNIWDAAKEVADKTDKIPVVALKVKGRHGFWLLIHSKDLISVANQRAKVEK